MEASCTTTVKKLQSLSVQPRSMCSLLLRALPKLLGLPPTLLKKFSNEEQVHPPLLEKFSKEEQVHPSLLETTRSTLPELPQDILMDIFTFLEIPDLVRAGSVCPSWYSAYTSLCNLGQYKQSQTPCLLYTSETDSENVARLYSLVEKKSYKLILPEPPIRSRYLIGSSNGWLVTADDRSEMHLLNPITGEQIALPSVLTIEQVTPIFDQTGTTYKYHFSAHTATWCADPSRTLALGELRNYLYRKAFVFYDTSARSYIVVLIHNPYGQLSFAWLGDDKWTWLPPHDGFHDCVYKDGLLYAVASCGKNFAFNLTGPMVTMKLIMDTTKSFVFENVYIVQSSCGDLLQVWRKRGENGYDEDADSPMKIDIFKVDTKAEKLVKINSLYDHVLVLGHNQSLCLNAEEYPQLKANHVYFTDDEEYLFGSKNNRRDIGVFDVGNNISEELVSPQLWSNWPAPIWITPALTKLCPTVKMELRPTPVWGLRSCNPACLRAAYICFCIICAYLIGWGTIL